MAYVVEKFISTSSNVKLKSAKEVPIDEASKELPLAIKFVGVVPSVSHK